MPTYSITTEQELESFLGSHETVVLDFWAKWCPPCRGFAPVFESAANQNPDMAFLRVNTEDADELKQAFEVESIPTLVAIRERVLVLSHAGYMDKSALVDALDRVRALDMERVRSEAAVEAS